MNNLEKKYNDVLLFSNGAHFKKDIQGWTTLYKNEQVSGNKAFDVSVYKKNDRIVIAFAGTKIYSGNDLRSDSQIFRNKLPFQFYNAVELYQKIISNAEYKNCKIEFVGYSLGGTISNLMSHYTGLPSTALAPIGSKNIANSAYYKKIFKYDDSNIVTFGRKNDSLFSKPLKQGYQSGCIVILPDLQVSNHILDTYRNHELKNFNEHDIDDAKIYSEYGNDLQIKIQTIRPTYMYASDTINNISDIYQYLGVSKKQIDEAAFSGWRNPINGNDQIYTKEDIKRMPIGEIAIKKNELSWQARKVGIPTEQDLKNAQVRYGNVIHVNAYVRKSGVHVRDYWRSLR